MAWTYTQDFDSLSTADLNGQDSWSGSTNFDVSTSSPIQGTKSVLYAAAAEGEITRTITSITSGTFIAAFKKGTITAGHVNPYYRLREGATYLCQVSFGGNTSPSSIWVQGSTEAAAATGLSVDTNYWIQVDFDNSTDQVRAKAATSEAGLTSASYTSWINYSSVATNVDTLILGKSDGGTENAWFDDIKPAGAAATTSISTMLMMGV